MANSLQHPCVVCGRLLSIGLKTTTVICLEPCLRLYPESLIEKVTPSTFQRRQKTASVSHVTVPLLSHPILEGFVTTEVDVHIRSL